jgi:hypothetical protein
MRIHADPEDLDTKKATQIFSAEAPRRFWLSVCLWDAELPWAAPSFH